MRNFKEILKKENPVIIDVRSNEEYRADHVSKAINIPVDVIGNPKYVYELKEMRRPIILCCRTGNRSQTALQKLVSAGVTNIYDAGSCTDFYQRNVL